jgi:hypothetical protein
MPAVGGSAEIAFVTVHAEAVVQARPARARSDRFRTTNRGEAALREPAEPDRAV